MRHWKRARVLIMIDLVEFSYDILSQGLTPMGNLQVALCVKPVRWNTQLLMFQ